MNALGTISTLKELNLQHNAVTGLNDLSSLSELVTLDVSYNTISSIIPTSLSLILP